MVYSYPFPLSYWYSSYIRCILFDSHRIGWAVDLLPLIDRFMISRLSIVWSSRMPFVLLIGVYSSILFVVLFTVYSEFDGCGWFIIIIMILIIIASGSYCRSHHLIIIAFMVLFLLCISLLFRFISRQLLTQIDIALEMEYEKLFII